MKVPGNDTVWTASADTLSAGHPVTLSWDNGAGLTFQLQLSVDDDYMFNVQQSVKNATGAPVKLFPWARIRRDYTPEVAGYYILFEGLLGVVDGTLHEDDLRQGQVGRRQAERRRLRCHRHRRLGRHHRQILARRAGPGPVGAEEAHLPLRRRARRRTTRSATSPRTPTDRRARRDRQPGVAPVRRRQDRATCWTATRREYHIPNFDKAVDFGWFYLLTKPIFYCLDWLNGILGNFGLAIMAFTTCVKLLFFPLANYSYRSMSKMKLLGAEDARRCGNA